MTLDAIVGALRACPVFARIDDPRLKLIALTGQTLRFRAGETLFERGDAGDAAFIVVTGGVDVQVTADGVTRTLARLGRGELFGEIAAICDRPRIATVVASEDLSVLRLDRAVLRRLLVEFTDLALEVIRIMANRLDAANLSIMARAPGPPGAG